MVGKNILILEDDKDRIREFKCAIASFGNFDLYLWRNSRQMINQFLPLLSSCCLISLDHDLNPLPGVAEDPGTGLEVSEFLSHQKPICPIIIHTSNIERRWSMFNELRLGKWEIEIVAPLAENWIQNSWLPTARTLLKISG
jgi:FixJ family two-component response regulator